MDKELERKIREEAAYYLFPHSLEPLTVDDSNMLKQCAEFVIKMVKKYGADNKTI